MARKAALLGGVNSDLLLLGAGVAVVAVAAVAVVATLVGVSAIPSSGVQGPFNRAFASPVFKRPVFHRVYQTYPIGSSTYIWTCPGQTPSSIGATLASLRPSYVASLVRTDGAAPTLSPAVLADYATIRNAVLLASPAAKFDIVIRTSQFLPPSVAPGTITSFMQQLVPQLPFDMFFLSDLDQIPAALSQEAITAAHGLGKLAVGDYAPAGGQVLPNPPVPGLDAISTIIPSVLPLQLPPFYPTIFAQNLPTLTHVDNFSPNRETFIQNWSKQQRSDWLTQASGGQSPNGCAFMYNTGMPQAPISICYDALADGTVPLMQQLMQQNNPS